MLRQPDTAWPLVIQVWNSSPFAFVLKDSPQGCRCRLKARGDAQDWTSGSDVLLLLLVGDSVCAHIHGLVPHYDGRLKSMATDVYI